MGGIEKKASGSRPRRHREQTELTVHMGLKIKKGLALTPEAFPDLKWNPSWDLADLSVFGSTEMSCFLRWSFTIRLIILKCFWISLNLGRQGWNGHCILYPSGWNMKKLFKMFSPTVSEWQTCRGMFQHQLSILLTDDDFQSRGEKMKGHEPRITHNGWRAQFGMDTLHCPWFMLWSLVIWKHSSQGQFRKCSFTKEALSSPANSCVSPYIPTTFPLHLASTSNLEVI